MKAPTTFPATVYRINVNEQTTVLAVRVPSLAQGRGSEYQRAFAGVKEIPIFVVLDSDDGEAWIDACAITAKSLPLYCQFEAATKRIGDWRKLDWKEEHFQGIPPSNWERGSDVQPVTEIRLPLAQV